MRLLLALLLFISIPAALAQEPKPFCGDGNVDQGEVCDDGNTADWDGCKADCSAVEEDEDVVLHRDLVRYEHEKRALLHNQQEFNQANMIATKAHFDAAIARWQAKLDEAGNAGRFDLAGSIQDKIDALTIRRDHLDSTAEGSPSDKASKHGPRIAQLSQLIGQIKEQLGIE